MRNYMIQLTKTSSVYDLRFYFNKILELYKQNKNNQFPVDLDEVYGLVYESRDKAYTTLKDNFIEGIDYQILYPNGEKLPGRPKVGYMLSIPCVEYFIARKVRAVFDIYRQVFHAVAESKQLPQTYVAALRELANEVELRELAEKKVIELTPKAEVFDKISNATNLLSMTKAAKLLGTGRKRLFSLLKDKKLLNADNIPYQEYIERGYFKVKVNPIQMGSHGEINYPQTYVTAKGLTWLGKGIVKLEKQSAQPNDLKSISQ